MDSAALTDGCVTGMPINGTTTIGLLPNPVSPAAMTAIVVLTCLGIVCILATFFFWPKCHLSSSQVAQKQAALAKKKRGKNVTMTSTGEEISPVVASGNGYAAGTSSAAAGAAEAARLQAYGSAAMLPTGSYNGLHGRGQLMTGDYVGGVGPSAA